MAKKSPKPAKPAKAKKPKAGKSRGIKKTLKQPPLIDNVRDTVQSLEDVCGSIADVRATMADCRQDEKGYVQTALQEMRKHHRTTYKAHGVTLTRVPGEEKLLVKSSGAEGSQPTAEVEPATDADSDTDSDEIPF